MGKHDRHLSDSLFESGFDSLNKGAYEDGLNTIRIAAGADRWDDTFESYDPATGISAASRISRASRGHLDNHGNYDPALVARPKPDPPAVVFMGAEAEFKGFIERRTGTSPDYRARGFVNHLGQAIAHYRRAEKLGYPVATWRLEALKLKLGGEDFRTIESSYNAAADRAIAHTNDLRDEILGQFRSQKEPDTATKASASTSAARGNALAHKTRANHWKGRLAMGGHLWLQRGPENALIFRSHGFFQRRYELRIPLSEIASVSTGSGGIVSNEWHVARTNGSVERFVVAPRTGLSEALDKALAGI